MGVEGYVERSLALGHVVQPQNSSPEPQDEAGPGTLSLALGCQGAARTLEGALVSNRRLALVGTLVAATGKSKLTHGHLLSIRGSLLAADGRADDFAGAVAGAVGEALLACSLLGLSLGLDLLLLLQHLLFLLKALGFFQDGALLLALVFFGFLGVLEALLLLPAASLLSDAFLVVVGVQLRAGAEAEALERGSQGRHGGS